MDKKSVSDGNIKEKHIKRHAAAIIAAALAALWIIFELAVFLVTRPTSPEIDFYSICTESIEKNAIDIVETRTLRTSGSHGAVQTISFEVVRSDGDSLPTTLPRVDVFGYDPAVSRRILYTSNKICIGDDGAIKNVIKLDIPKGASDIALTFNYTDCDYTVTNVRINADGDVTFNFSRCLIVIAIIALLGICAHFKLWQVFFDGEKHGYYALAVCLVCVILTMIMASAINPNPHSVSYPLDNSVASYNPYVQQFDAIMKGQLHIDYMPSEELLALENPYDYSARDGIYYLWDRALYDGKYYSYFGMAPVFSLYLPFYALTGSLPSDNVVSTVFTLMTSLFFSMAAVKWAAMRTKKIPLPLILIGTVSALFSTQAYLLARGNARFYYIATISGMAFLSAFIWLFLCGISGSIRLNAPKDEPPAWRRPLIFALAGIAFGLCFLSRFNIALVAAFAILPMLWFSVVTRKKDGEKRSFRPVSRIAPELVCLALPVIAAVVFQLWLNVVRFDSLFEFGTTYQLTVSDISRNKIRLTDLPAAIFHYFLHPLLPGVTPPFVSLYYTSLNSYGHYVYVDTGMGLLSIPLNWALVTGVGILTRRRGRAEDRITLASVLLGLVVVALFDFCLGGVIFRYTCDLTLVAAFASMALVYATCERATEHGSEALSAGVSIAASALFALSLIVSVCLALSDNANLTPCAPEFYSFFRSLFGA